MKDGHEKEKQDPWTVHKRLKQRSRRKQQTSVLLRFVSSRLQ